MKYIDSEKLIAEIKIIQQSLEHSDVRYNQVKKIRTECMIEFCKCLYGVIDSLQQEQPSEGKRTCKTCGFYENDCPFVRGKFIPYPSIVCKDYTPITIKE